MGLADSGEETESVDASAVSEVVEPELE